MKTEVTILFIGLVLHMNLLGSNTAVLPFVDGHQAAMLIWHADNTISSVIRLEHKTVDVTGAVSDLGDGNTTHLDGFQNYVPKLGDITTCSQVQRVVEKHDFSPKFSAYVMYEGGKLDAFGYHDKKVMFTNSSAGEQCAACAVAWSGVPTGKTITMTVSDELTLGMVDRYLLKPGDVVLLRNAPPVDASGAPAATGDHFPHNFDTLLNCNDTNHHVKAGGACGLGNCFLTLLTKESARAKELRGKAAMLRKRSRVLHKEARSLLEGFLIPPSSDCTNSQFP